jgi:hypothetical protein
MIERDVRLVVGYVAAIAGLGMLINATALVLKARGEEARPAHCPPRAWCGCYLAHFLGLHDRRLWLAREWARLGRATTPAPGAVVVWRHHVGQIVRVTAPGKAIVKSGNDGRRVRTRERSIRDAIAFRQVGA